MTRAEESLTKGQGDKPLNPSVTIQEIGGQSVAETPLEVSADDFSAQGICYPYGSKLTPPYVLLAFASADAGTAYSTNPVRAAIDFSEDPATWDTGEQEIAPPPYEGINITVTAALFQDLNGVPTPLPNATPDRRTFALYS